MDKNIIKTIKFEGRRILEDCLACGPIPRGKWALHLHAIAKSCILVYSIGFLYFVRTYVASYAAKGIWALWDHITFVIILNIMANLLILDLGMKDVEDFEQAIFIDEIYVALGLQEEELEVLGQMNERLHG
ncbi:unnamed protein product [Dovyalis caffra]|uniref:Uncharacterized protein n=1 Tax=Dovyalis caffra TaxID=77055 RepID=A0AAV1R0J1_9ROSI|nr:unnamed protein product [Dovyalis caffra]